MTEQVIRPARAADIPRLMEIRAAVRENRLVTLVIGPDAYRPYVENALCWVAEADNTIHAFAALDAVTASIWALFVDPACEGQGLGRTLLARLIEEARLRALPALTLETAAGTRAEAVYRRAGFTVAREGETVHMTLSLTAA